MPVADTLDTGLTDDEPQLWRRWRDDTDLDARASLLDLHLPYARKIAAIYFGRRFNEEVPFDDYLQLATVGLIESMERFDPDVGVSFRTFAARRMHGSIIDGIEQSTEKQQQIAARSRLLGQRRESFREADNPWSGLVQTPAARTSEQLLQYVAEVGMGFALGWVLDGCGMALVEEPAQNMPFYRSAELNQLRERVVELMKQLTDREHAVVRAHYFQGLAFEEIATHLQISKGRVSQLHKRALERLRDYLRAGRACDISA